MWTQNDRPLTSGGGAPTTPFSSNRNQSSTRAALARAPEAWQGSNDDNPPGADSGDESDPSATSGPRDRDQERPALLWPTVNGWSDITDIDNIHQIRQAPDWRNYTLGARSGDLPFPLPPTKSTLLGPGQGHTSTPTTDSDSEDEESDEPSGTDDEATTPFDNVVQVSIANISTRGPGFSTGIPSRNPIEKHNQTGQWPPLEEAVHYYHLHPEEYALHHEVLDKNYGNGLHAIIDPAQSNAPLRTEGTRSSLSGSTPTQTTYRARSSNGTSSKQLSQSPVVTTPPARLNGSDNRD